MVDVCSNVVLRRQWFAVALSSDVRSHPVAVRLLGEALVLFRTATGDVAALPDRCSHNGSPLSIGRVADGCIVCPYHGWIFDGDGQCLTPPVSIGGRTFPRPPITPAAATEADGMVWVRLVPDDSVAAVDWALPALPVPDATVGSMLGHLPASPLEVMAALLEMADGRSVDTPHPFAVRFTTLGALDEVVVVVPADAAESVLVSLRPSGSEGLSPAARLRADTLGQAGKVLGVRAMLADASRPRAVWQHRIGALLAGAV